MKGRRSDDPYTWYDGPLRRADGKRAYNNYWWPTEDCSYVLREWRPNLANAVRCDIRISLIPLNNGAWTSEGHTYSPQLATRAEALEAAIAKIERTTRRQTFGALERYDFLGRWSAETYTGVFAWLRWVRDEDRRRPQLASDYALAEDAP